MRFGIAFLCFFASVKGDFFTPPDLARELEALDKDDFVTYAALHGMNLKYYDAVTPDGWILRLWRVRSPNIFEEQFSAPVIVSHGFGSSSFDYMLNLRNQSIAFILADNGYDVWLTNYRANEFSNLKISNGIRRMPQRTEYYKAAWQNMAEIDFPTIIDTVLNETKQSKAYVIGHSMGTTIPFASLSENHSYDDKISHFAAVVPVLKFGDDTSLYLRTTLKYAPPIVPWIPKPLFRLAFGGLVGASDGKNGKDLESELKATVCKVVPPICFLAYNLMFTRSVAATIATNPHLNKTRGSIYFSKSPAGVTLMNAYNYGVQWNRTPWTKIDYDRIPKSDLTNMGEYNRNTPPEYNFAALNVSFSMFYVNNDVFTGPKTARAVVAELQAKDVKFIDGNNLDHADSVVGIDTRCYTLDDILSKFRKLEADRDDNHRNYRRKVETFLASLPYENGCLNRTP